MRTAAVIAVGATGVQAAAYDATEMAKYFLVHEYADATKCGAAGLPTKVTPVQGGQSKLLNCAAIGSSSFDVTSAACTTGMDGEFSGDADDTTCAGTDVTDQALMAVKADGKCHGVTLAGAFTDADGVEDAKKIAISCGKDTSLHPRVGVALGFSGATCAAGEFLIAKSRPFLVRATTGTSTDNPAGGDDVFIGTAGVPACWGEAADKESFAVETCEDGKAVVEKKFATRALCQDPADTSGVAMVADEATYGVGTDYRLDTMVAGECTGTKQGIASASAATGALGVVVICPTPANAVRGSAAAAFAAAAAWLLF